MPRVIIVERRGREDEVDTVINRFEELAGQRPEKRENTKTRLPQAGAQRRKTNAFLRFALATAPAMPAWQHGALASFPRYLRRCKSFKV
jgi:hypothetical protein